jgi:hypothetical protein
MKVWRISCCGNRGSRLDALFSTAEVAPRDFSPLAACSVAAFFYNVDYL